MAPGRADGDAATVKRQGNASTGSLRARSTPLRDKSNTHSKPRKSTNPFRQHQDLSKVSLTRSESQGTENSSASGVRKNAPPRAVFHDLPTAHSSITSGTARSKCRDPSNNLSETLDDDDEKSVLLQDMEPATRRNSFLDDLPLPPTPAVIPNGRYDEPTADCLLAQDDEIISEQRDRLTPSVQPETRLQPGSMFTTIKNALGTKSSPITVNDKSSTLTPKQRPKRMLHLNKTESYEGSTRHPTYKVPDASKCNPHTPQTKTKAIKLEEVRIGHSTDGYERDPSSIYRSSREEAQSSSLSLSSPKADDTIDRASHLEPFHLARPKGFGSYNEAVRIEDLASTPAGREQSLQLPPQISDGRIQSNEISSLPDGSTVGNIYKHYVGSLSDDDDEQSDLGLPRHMGSAERSSGSGLRPSALLVRKQRRAERAMSNLQVQPPQSSLPSAPSLAAQRTIPSSSQGLGHSSSYGDTYNLLDITQREHWTGLRPAMTRSDANNNLRSDHTSPEWGDSSIRTPFTSNNPFLGNLTPQVIISQPTDGEVIYDDAQIYTLTDRQPLEREVSNALRRASGISIYSNGSISSSILRYAEYRSDLPSSDSIGCLRRLQLEDTPVSDSGSVGGGSRNGDDHVQAFYDQGAIAPNWINNHHNNNVIRIPINHNGLFPDSPPHSPRPTSTLPSKNQDRGKSREADDVNDWETIGDSALGGEIKAGNSSQVLGMLGGTVGQAGSSIANTSDDGTASTYIPDIENYGSTERFIQHPGNTRYHGDYRRRDLKHTHTPVFLPEFREHKVNGYLADSNRTRPPVTLFNQSPHPLESDHEHPFKSPPPERMPVQKAKASPTPRNFLTPKPLSELNSLQTSETETTDDTSTNIIGPERRSIKPINGTYNWMDDFGEPGPAICPANLGLRPPSPQHRPSSYEHVMRIARGAVSGYNPNGTAITGGSREITNDPKSHSKASIDGLDKSNPTGKMGYLRSPRTHQPLVKGPPGAFFRGILHSGSTSRYAPRSHGGDGAAKSSTRQSSTENYPTNTLRPLSLLESRRASIPTTPTFDRKEPSQDTLPNDFVYRSPLAPPRRFSSQRLYSGSRLLEIKEAAKADGYEMRVLPTANSRTSSKDSRARKHIFEIPRLPWPREPSTRTDLCQEKKKLSISALCLCNLFPPLLFLYALGQLDGVVCWWTNGDISRFGKDQKRWAYILMACWGLITVLGLVSFLVYWFSFAG